MFHEITKERPSDMAEVIAHSHNQVIDRAESHLCRFRLYFTEAFQVIDGMPAAPWFADNIFGWEDANGNNNAVA